MRVSKIDRLVKIKVRMSRGLRLSIKILYETQELICTANYREESKIERFIDRIVYGSLKQVNGA